MNNEGAVENKTRHKNKLALAELMFSCREQTKNNEKINKTTQVVKCYFKKKQQKTPQNSLK